MKGTGRRTAGKEQKTEKDIHSKTTEGKGTTSPFLKRGWWGGAGGGVGGAHSEPQDGYEETGRKGTG